MKTMLLHWRVARYLSSVSSFDLFPGNWFLKCSVLLVNQATAAPKALLCELFSLASCVSCFYPPFSSYFHKKFRLLCSDPVSQHIWHPFDFFLLPALHLQVRANIRSQLASLCGSFRQIRNTEGSTNSASGFNQYFLRVWHKSSLFFSNPLLCDTLTAWSLQAE